MGRGDRRRLLASSMFLLMAFYATSFAQGTGGASSGLRDDRPQHDAEGAIAHFIRTYYLSNWFNEPANIRRQFSDPVEHYWGKTNVPLREVLKDKSAYYGRWPSGQYRLIDASFSAAPISDRAQTYSVRFDYEFVTENDTKRASGLPKVHSCEVFA